MWRTLHVVLRFVILHRRLGFCPVGGDKLIHQTLTLLRSPLEKQWQLTKETDCCNFPFRTKHWEEMIYYGALLNTTFSKRRIQACSTVSLKKCLLHKGKKALQRGTRVGLPQREPQPSWLYVVDFKEVFMNIYEADGMSFFHDGSTLPFRVFLPMIL